MIKQFFDAIPQFLLTLEAWLHMRVATPTSALLAPTDAETQELNSLLADIHPSGFRFVEGQAARIEPSFYSFQQLCPATRAAENDKVIRIPHHPRFEFFAFVNLFVQPVQIQVGQQRRDHPALGRPLPVCSPPRLASLALFPFL